MMSIFNEIYNYIASTEFNQLLKNLTQILAIIGILFGFFFAYLVFARDLKFGVIKKIIEEDHEGRKSFTDELIKY